MPSSVGWPGFFILSVLMVIGAGWGCERPAQERAPGIAIAAAGGEAAQEEEQSRCVIDDDCETFYRCIMKECVVPPAMTGELSKETPTVTFKSADGQERAEFYLELALTPREQQQGLMHRPHMRDDWGMLFVYDRDRVLSFWMKNTLIPLDMIFINDAGEVVGIVEKAEPQTLEPRRVEGLSRYVVEINGGLASTYGIVAGDKMSLENVDERYRPRR